MYYDTNQAAELLGVKASKVRFYEKQFKLKFKRAGRDRQITEQDIEKLRILINERKEGKKTLKGVEESINKKKAINKKKTLIKEKMLTIRAFLQQTLEEL